MSPLLIGILGVSAILLNALGMACKDLLKTKIILGTSIVLIIPDLYNNNGIHGVYQSVVVALMFYFGALAYRKIERAILYTTPILSILLLLNLKESEGLLLVIASISTPLATISKDSFKMKLLLLLSTLSWGTYAFLVEAYYTLVYDILGMMALIYFFSTYKIKKV